MSEPNNSQQLQPEDTPRRKRSRLLWLDLVLIVLGLLGLGSFLWSYYGGRDQLTTDADKPVAYTRATARGDRSFSQRLAQEYQKVDPVEDGWETETFHDAANAQLKHLSKLIAHPEDLSATQLSDLVTEDCTSGPLRPSNLQEVFADSSLVILRPANSSSASQPTRHRTAAGLAGALGQLCEPLEELQSVRVKFKQYRVQLNGDRAASTVFLTTTGRASNGVVQQNATWKLIWSLPETNSPPRLAGIQSEAYEEVRVTSPHGTLLAECTSSVLGGSQSYREELLPSMDHWTGSLHDLLGMEGVGYSGIALGDVNGDALDDIYVCQPGGLPNRLFLQSPDGTAHDISASAGVDWLERSRSALLVDLDNDADQDLVVATQSHVLIMRNDGDGHFTRHEVIRPQGKPTSMAAADYDSDGDLDLYLCGYGDLWGGVGEFDSRYPMPYHDANNGGANTLLRNDGQLHFTNVTRQVGLDVNNRRWSLAVGWEDFDNDGDQDLYVSNDFGRNNLYRNDDGRFVDIAETAGVEDISPGMSIDWGDYDNDGLMDIYISNMFSGAGNRITFQDRFQTSADEETRSHFQRFARGNALFQNKGSGEFTDSSVEAGVTVGRWAWGSRFADLNNDGWQDLIVANGFFTQEDTSDL